MPRIRKCFLGCPKHTRKHFQIPFDERRDKWFAVMNAPKQDFKYLYVCDLHFSRIMYADNRLKKTAIPDMSLKKYTEPIIEEPNISKIPVEPEHFTFGDIISVDSKLASRYENDTSTDSVCRLTQQERVIEPTPAMTTINSNISLPQQSALRTELNTTNLKTNSNLPKIEDIYTANTIKPSISSTDYTNHLTMTDAIIHLKQLLDQKFERKTKIKNKKRSATDIIRDEILKLPDDIQERVHDIMKNNCYRRYPSTCSDDLKALSLAVFFISPIAYGYFKQIFNWPDEKMLKAFISEWPTEPGLSMDALNKLQLRSNLIILNCRQLTRQTTLHYNNKKNRICGIDNDEEGTAKTTVMTLCITAISFTGESWQQPLAYYVLHDSVTKLKMIKLHIFNAIGKLQEIHFHPKKLLCDRTVDFECFAKTIGIMDDSGYFIVNEKKVMFEYDTT